MALRYLFGPVTSHFVEQNLGEAGARGSCIAFGSAGSELVLDGAKSSDDVCRRLPEAWQPDLVVLYLPYTSIASGLWSAPVPIVGLAADWNLQFQQFRRQLKSCDLVLTDTAGLECFRKAGIAHVRAANLFGCERAFLEGSWSDQSKEIDILFVGNFHPAVQRERLKWLGRIARLSYRWNVHIGTGIFGDGYRELLGRSRIVFNRSIRGEGNKRVFEATAAGALLFQEQENLETHAFFGDRQECVYYNDDNLEELLEHFLENEDERRRIAEAARARVQEFSFERLWQQQIRLIEEEWPTLLERAKVRQDKGPGAPDLVARLWQAVSSDGPDPALATDLAQALVQEPRSAWLHQALGILVARQAQGSGPITDQIAREVTGYFRRAVASDPHHPMAGLNLTEALLGAGELQGAQEAARQALQVLERGASLNDQALNMVHFPPVYDLFRVEWEKAAWHTAGDSAAEADAKKRLIAWRLHSILAEVTGELRHYYEAVLARPDLGISRSFLGCALARAKQYAQAVPHLRFAVEENPFDANAARALFQALEDSGDSMGKRRLARHVRLLAKAAPRLVSLEEWAARTPPSGEELASIIILCCNEMDYTRQCLDSVLEHTRRPYELILVDNGSTDGTPGMLERFRRESGPERVAITRNATNRGFAAGCNQGLAKARGDYLVFLNNDTVVTPGWLDRLVICSLADWPNVGMVGPVSNYAPPPQQVTGVRGQGPGVRGEMDRINEFAARREREFAGSALVVERLTGFCLLVRREVVQQIGNFDESYGLGFFEDDDLCVRAGQAGFRLLVAQDVYIHHYGSRTVQSLGIDGYHKLQENFERFKEKWGEERAAGYRMASEKALTATHSLAKESEEPTEADHAEAMVQLMSLASVPSAQANGRMRVSLSMIVKNEEANLPGCLLSCADLFDEIVIADTGSTDQTKEIAHQYGARVVDFPWIDNFAAARNESLQHVTGDWVLWLDADDRLDEENRQKLRELFGGLKDENVAYIMKCRCSPDAEAASATVVDHVRLFRNRPDVRWKYRVHEQILGDVKRSGAELRYTDIVIEHTGYLDAEVRRQKLEKYLRLLHLDHAEDPDEPFVLFNLGWSYESAGKPAEALDYLRRSLQHSHPTDSIVRKLYSLIVACHRQLGQRQETLAACQEGRQICPQDAELLFQEARLLGDLGKPDLAEKCFLELITGTEASHFASVEEGTRGHIARHHLATLYFQQGRFAEAEAQWQAASAAQPHYTAAWLGLGELYLRQHRFEKLDKILHGPACNGHVVGQGRAGIAHLSATKYLAQREFVLARQVLEQALEKFPREAGLWELLSYALLQQHEDLDAAEGALCKLLELEPDNAQARNNLGVLLRELGRDAR
jgi:glycosyltransferase involved in cell wall biosynthesis/Flp pilus assembly protein TadD